MNPLLSTNPSDIQFVYNKVRECSSVSIDSRQVTPNDFFIALNGETSNGHAFAKDAIHAGATYALIDDPTFKNDDQHLLVDNTLTFLQGLATYHRKKMPSLHVIAIAGSNGKTTTKELMYRVLNTTYNTMATPGNWNNHIGVPLSILACDHTTDMAVIEMGANHIDEHTLLCQIAQPNYGIITNCGKDHLEGYGSEEGVIQSNNELYAYLSRGNHLAFVNADDTTLKKLSTGLRCATYGGHDRASESMATGTLTHHYPFVRIRVDSRDNTNDSFIINTHLYGRFQRDNILSAVAVGRYFRVDDALIKNAIEGYIPSNNRSQVIFWNDNTVLLDSYNANPSSMSMMIADFSDYPVPNKIVILGDMRELGTASDAEHKAIIHMIKHHDFKQVILVGDAFGEWKDAIDCLHFKTSASLKTHLECHPFSGCHVLVKGSRGIALETAFSHTTPLHHDPRHLAIPRYDTANWGIWKSVPIVESHEPLVELSNVSKKIQINPMYYNQRIEGAIQECYVRETVRDKLLMVARGLPDHLRLLIFDAWRPLHVQQSLFDSFKAQLKTSHPHLSHDELIIKTQTYVSLPSSDPLKPSPHYTGGSVDVTLIDQDNNDLNMGTVFDDFRPIAQTRYFETVDDGFSQTVLENRRLLYHMMVRAGFTNYSSEWWHFDYGNQFWATCSNTVAIYGGIEPEQ